MTEYPMWIGGSQVRTAEPAIVRLPYDGSEVATVFNAAPEQVERAIEAAKRAAPVMRAMTRATRAEILRKACAGVNAQAEEMARAISLECGKPIREARVEADRSARTLLFAAEEAHRIAGEDVPMDASPAGAGRMALFIREPLGVIATIAQVNRSEYGLQAGIFTRDLERAFRAARAVHVGGFLINDVPQFRVDQMPYGGVKLSGTCREGPRYAIEEMTEMKLISWRI